MSINYDELDKLRGGGWSWHPSSGVRFLNSLDSVAPGIINGASGNLVTISDGASMPVRGLVSEIRVKQEGTGDPSPDNVRPLTAWDAVSVSRSGVNLLPYPYFDMDGVETNDGKFTVNPDGSITASGTPSDYMGMTLYDGPALGKGLVTTGIVGDIQNAVLQLDIISNGQTLLTNQFANLDDYAGICGLRMRITIKRRASSTPMSGTGFPVLVCGGSIPVKAEAGRVETLSADLPETVYGGTINWTTGVLTIDSHAIQLTGNERWTSEYFNNATRFSTKDGIAAGILLDGNVGADAACSHYQYGRNPIASNDVDKVIALYSKYSYPYIRDDSFTTVEELVAYLKAQAAAGTPVQIVYKLAEPRTIQLTPQQLDMLNGVNNVWSDSGDTSLVYIADTKLYIDNAIAAIAALIQSL